MAIVWSRPGEKPAVEVTGLPAAMLREFAARERSESEWGQLFAVRVESPAGAAVPAMAGQWRVTEARLRFEPSFPWASGVRLRAEVRRPGMEPLVSTFEPPPAAAGPATEVVAIFPQAEVLPENQLKFYVQFSGAMSRGEVYRHLHLRDEAGRAIELPFLELDEELWDPGLTRLTLLIDPGRIKRGVKPLVDIGPVFEVGRRYSLSIEPTMVDGAGRPLKAAYRKEFRIGPADRTPPDPGRWQVVAPAAGTRQPLVVTFDEPLDHALALRLISVASETGQAIAGSPALSGADQRWEFRPAQAWSRGRHRLIVVTTIEDLAGNNIGKVFDVDLFAGVQRRISSETVAVPFEVR